MRCPHCQHENPPGAKFCVECAGLIARRCSACGTEAPPTAKFCPECAAPLTATPHAAPQLAAPPELATPGHAPAGERRQLTVLFCDLVGSTPLSQQLDAEEWRDLIARYQQAAAGAVARFGGHVAKNLGDGLLIYFGWPSAREGDPERAVRAGLAIVEAVRVLAVRLLGEERSSQTSDPLTANSLTPNTLSVRVGMHTGPVVIADGGEVFGETANVAARVQGAAEPDTVVITAATQRLVAGLFVIEDRGPQMLKGVREPVPLYRVVQASGVRSRLDVAAGRLTRFVGRDMELGTLVDRWGRARDGEGQNVVVLGEAGVGKSRLVYQLHEHLADVPHTWLECGATPYTEGTPFHPVIALAAQALAFAPEDTAAEQLGKLENGLGALASTESVALLADFLGLPPPTRLQLSPELQRRKTIDLLVQWTLSLSAAQPLVVFVEDLHWCDVSTLELLGHLIAQSPTARVLLLATARPEFTPTWPARSNLTTVQLARLTKRQARDMIATLAGTELPAATLDAIVARADGVPLYVEELTKAVLEPGAAHGVEAIPASLADSLMARLDRLSAAKEVAQRAAVLGREFGYPLLAAMAGMDEAALRQGLGRLVDAEIVFARGEPPAATYTFKHALIQETAYESLLKRTRQQLHGRVVDALVREFSERATAEPEVVARHAEMAGRVDEAVAYYQRAGARAQTRSAHREATGHFQRAIAHLASLAERPEREQHEARLQLALGESLGAVRGYAHDDAGAAFTRARELAERSGDADDLAAARIGLAVQYISRGDCERGRRLAAEVLGWAEERGDSDAALRAHTQIAAAELYQGELRSSLAHADSALALYNSARHRALSGTDLSIASLSYVAANLWMLGRADTALARAEQAAAAARQLGHPFSLAFALGFAATISWWLGDRRRQQALGAELITLSDEQGFPLWLGIGHVWRGAARVAGGDFTGLTEMMDGLATAGETGNQAGAPLFFGILAEAQQTAGLPADARQTVATGLAVAEYTGQHSNDAELQRIDGALLLATGGTPADAEALFGRALDIARSQQAKAFELRAATSLARLWQRQGKRDEARDLLAPVYGWFTEGFDTRDLIEAKALLEEP